MNSSRRILFVWFTLAFSCGVGFAQNEPSKPAPKKTVRLLTIGNSFSEDATFFLDDLAAADGNLLIQKKAVIGGSSMQQHWDKAQLHEKDPADKAGLYTSGKGLKDLL